MMSTIVASTSRLICSALLAIAASAVAAQDTSSKSHALLIGIGDYSGTGLDSLKGPVNDVALMRSLLTSRFSIPAADITILQNDQATHSKIRSAFAALTARIKSGDTVYIYYSGHGSYVPDKTVQSGQLETWVTYGARSKKNAGVDDFDVLSKEIAGWLAPIYEKSKAVVFVSDSCHSATVSRGATGGVRAAPPDPRPHPVILQSTNLPQSMPGVRIGAARDIESAVELDVESGGQCLDGSKCQGVFTWYWVQALQQAKPGDRWNDVFSRAYTLVTMQRGVSQRPQMEGRMLAPVFGGNYAPEAVTIPVTTIDAAARSVALAAGSVNGVTKGSTYSLHDAGARDEPSRATIEIASVQPFASQATIRTGALKAGDLVVETSHVFPFEPIRLFVTGEYAGDLDRALVARMQSALKTVEGFRLADDKGQADWIVYITRPGKDVKTDDAPGIPASFRDRPPEAWVISPQGRLLHDRMRMSLADEMAGIADLKKNLASHARATEIKRLQFRMQPLPVSAEMTLWRSNRECRDACVYLAADVKKEQPFGSVGGFALADAVPEFSRGDVLSFKLKNTDRRPWYAYLLNISADGSIQVLFPGQYDNREEALLKPGETRDLAGDFLVQFNTPGDEVIKLIVANESIEARLFENPGFVARRSELNPLEGLLVKAMTTRADVQRVSVREWGTEQTQFLIKR